MPETGERPISTPPTAPSKQPERPLETGSRSEHDLESTPGPPRWDRDRWLQLGALLLSALALVSAFVLPWDKEGMAAAGYGGIFLVALVTGVAPGPTTVLVFLAARSLNPLQVAFWSGLGSAIGESSSYSAGFGSQLLVGGLGGPRWLLRSRPYRWIERNIVGWMGRHPFLTLYLFGAVPNFAIDVAGIVAGRMGYPFRRYFLAMLLGKWTRFWFIATLGYLWLG